MSWHSGSLITKVWTGRQTSRVIEAHTLAAGYARVSAMAGISVLLLGVHNWKNGTDNIVS